MMATFGCLTVGDSFRNLNNNIDGSVFTCPTSGTTENITAYITTHDGEVTTKCAIYRHSDGSLVGETEEYTGTFCDWHVYNFPSPVHLVADTEYVLVAFGQGYASLAYAGGIENQGHYQSRTYSQGFPSTASFNHDNIKCSIYCSYTSATSLVVKINGESVDSISANVQPKSLNQGHQLFTILVDNLNNKYAISPGPFHANDVVEIYIEDILVFTGIIDSIKHQPECQTKWNWRDYLRIAGRDNSFELAGYKITKIWPSSWSLTDIFQDALDETDCPIDTINVHGDPPNVGGHSIQDGYLFDLIRDLLAKSNSPESCHDWYADISAGNDSIDFFEMNHADLETGITLTDVLGLPNLIEEDGLEIRNYIEVLGAATLRDPEDMDAWTETTTEGWSANAELQDDCFIGNNSIRAHDPGSPHTIIDLNYTKNFSLLYGQNTTIKFTNKIYPYPANYSCSEVRLYTTDTDYFKAHFNCNSSWGFISMALGPNIELSDANPDGIWTRSTAEADWFNITKIGFHHEFNTSLDSYFYVDGLFLYPARPRGFAEVSGGAENSPYGKREITVINDDLTTQVQCQAKADSQLEKLKDPAMNIPHVICKGIDFIVDGDFLAKPARFVTFDMPVLSGKYRMENIAINVAPRQNLGNGYDFTVEFDGIPDDALVDARRLYKVTKGRVTPKEII
jgi:hypothetical protein